jgi:hypothetical protein
VHRSKVGEDEFTEVGDGVIRALVGASDFGLIDAVGDTVGDDVGDAVGDDVGDEVGDEGVGAIDSAVDVGELLGTEAKHSLILLPFLPVLRLKHSPVCMLPSQRH